MAQEVAEIVQKCLEAFSRPGRPPEHLFDPDVEIRESSELPGELAGTGYDNLVRAHEMLFDSFESITLESEEAFDLGERFLVFVRVKAIGKGSGTPVEGSQGHLLRVQSGKVTEWALFSDRAEALKAAGLQD